MSQDQNASEPNGEIEMEVPKWWNRNVLLPDLGMLLERLFNSIVMIYLILQPHFVPGMHITGIYLKNDSV